MQCHIPQDYGTVAEIQELMGVNRHIVSSQASRPIMGIIQDCLSGSYILTQMDTVIPRHQFMDCVLSAGPEYVDILPSFIKRARKYYAPEKLYCGKVLFSILLPETFKYSRQNNACKVENTVQIENGILISGVIDKSVIGKTQASIIHRLFKEHGHERAAEFITALQFMVNRWLSYCPFSVGIKDFIISAENRQGVHEAIQKAYLEVESIQSSDEPAEIKEFKINSALNNRGQSLAINGLCEKNRLEIMVNSGSKGNRMNIIQITGHLGQNNVEGRRMRPEIDDGRRTLPCFRRNDNHPKSNGFIESCFLRGLSPAEFFFHSKAGREGVINTAVKTRDSGYAERKLVKRMEDLVVEQDMTVRNSVGGVIDFTYGECLDPAQMYFSGNNPSFIDIDNVVAELNAEVPERLSIREAQEILRDQNKIFLK